MKTVFLATCLAALGAMNVHGAGEDAFYKLGPDGSPALGVFVGPEMQLAPVSSPLRQAIPAQAAPVPNTHELRLP